VVFRRNRVVGNHGEGLQTCYVRHALIEDNFTGDNLYANIGLNNVADAVVRRNKVIAVEPLLTRFGNPAKGIDIWVEKTGNCPFVASERIQILDNVIDGGAAKGVLYGIYWHKERRMLDVPEHTYSDVHIRGNTIRNTKKEKILFMLPLGRKPRNCRIDVALEAPGVKVSPEEAWTQWQWPSERTR